MKSIRTLLVFSAILLLAAQSLATTEVLHSKSAKRDFLNWLAGDSEASHYWREARLNLKFINNAKTSLPIKIVRDPSQHPGENLSVPKINIKGNGGTTSTSSYLVLEIPFLVIEVTATYPTGEVIVATLRGNVDYFYCLVMKISSDREIQNSKSEALTCNVETDYLKNTFTATIIAHDL